LTKEGKILASTSSGLYYLRDNRWQKFFALSSTYNFSFKSLKQLSDGRIACGNSEGLLLLSHEGNLLIGRKEKTEFLLKKNGLIN